MRATIEETFYRQVRDADVAELDEVVAGCVEEHHVVDALIEELAGLEAGGDEWVTKMHAIIQNVEHHATEEEQELFPLVRRVLDRHERRRLAGQLETRKAQLGAPTLADKEGITVEQLRRPAGDDGDAPWQFLFSEVGTGRSEVMCCG